MEKLSVHIPEEVQKVLDILVQNGYEAFFVGGSVRDVLRETEPTDWDITTNATPEQIQACFDEDDTFYENDFGTVGVKTRSENPSYAVVEVTPYRLESAYSDNRHPDEVTFSTKIEDDLQRRDFTVNAMALDVSHETPKIVDLYKGQEDLAKRTIRTVGNPDDRFQEDALRLLRAIRFSAQLDFIIEAETFASLMKNAHLLKNVSRERIRDEFSKIIMSKNPSIALFLMEKTGILDIVAPVLRETVGVSQNKQAHKFDVWEHLVRSLQHAADKDYPFHVRLAALFHDISKPETKRVSRETGATSFYGHEVVGARVTRETLQSLKYSKDTIETVSKLVRWHMFFADPDEVTLSAVRRIIAKVGQDMIWDLMNLRICDRIGTGRPKEEPYRFRKYKSMIEEALRDPVSLSMLKINGDAMITTLHMKPGPHIGYILHALFDEVLDDPSKNTEEFLMKRAEELHVKPLEELAELGKKGKQRLEDEDEKIVAELRKKHHVS